MCCEHPNGGGEVRALSRGLRQPRRIGIGALVVTLLALQLALVAPRVSHSLQSGLQASPQDRSGPARPASTTSGDDARRPPGREQPPPAEPAGRASGVAGAPLAATTSSYILGDQSIEGQPDNNPAGVAEAFQ
jgi:hypothetical protein